MIKSHAQRPLWPLTAIVLFGAGLTAQACSGRVLDGADCGGASSCAGAGGHAGVAGSSADSGSGGVDLGDCENGTADADESDVDCGGTSTCARCPSQGRCTTDEDCASKFCEGNRCAESTCTDGSDNGDETDVDCGGSCPACDTGASCSGDQDCSGQYCVDRVCADHCLSGLRDADETDKDCGGQACKPCADDLRCQEASDCQSLVCSKNSCRPASCSDQIKNQDESDLDCGGVCGASCPVAAHCNTQADCDSQICGAATSKCLPDIVIPPADVIDDLEDGDLMLPKNPALGGRVGNWYPFSDGTGTSSFDVATIERGASSVYGLSTSGKGHKSWGSGLAVSLNRSTVDNAPYDASGYAGITFWARAQSALKVTVSLPDVDTASAGMICSTCEHHYYKAVQVTTDWQRFTVPFSELSLEPGTVPSPTAFKPSGIFSVMFSLAANQNYELELDDLAFVK
jgi:hypothetical protein